MSKYLNMLVNFKRDEKGVTALEYGLIAALIAVVIIGAVTSLGSNLSATFNNVSGQLTTGAATGNSTKPIASK